MAGSNSFSGNVVDHWQVIGSYNRNVRDNEVGVELWCIMRTLSWAMRVNYLYAHCDINGDVNSTNNGSVSTQNGVVMDTELIYHSKVYSRTKADQTKTLKVAIVNNSGYLNGTSEASVTITIPALEHHTVSFNANGGTGAPASQTKWWGEILTISSVKPTRSGYTFVKWAEKTDGTGATVQPGGQYGLDQDITFYAIWTSNGYVVSYDANGGTGAPDAQTKQSGVTLYLSTVRPTRVNYTFLGWSTSKYATSATYQPGSAYTTNASITLYAVWQAESGMPKLLDVNIERCNSGGTVTDDGMYAKVTFSWECDVSVTSVKFTYPSSSSGTSTTYKTVSISGTKGGPTSVTIGGNYFNTEQSYEMTAVITASNGKSATFNYTIPGASYVMDIRSTGKGISFFGACSTDGFTVYGGANVSGTLTANQVTSSGAVQGSSGDFNSLTVGSSNQFSINTSGNITSSGSFAQNGAMTVSSNFTLNRYLYWGSYALDGDARKTLWSGSATAGSTITVSNSNQYDKFLCFFASGTTGVGILATRAVNNSTSCRIAGVSGTPWSGTTQGFILYGILAQCSGTSWSITRLGQLNTGPDIGGSGQYVNMTLVRVEGVI